MKKAAAVDVNVAFEEQQKNKQIFLKYESNYRAKGGNRSEEETPSEFRRCL